jgi:WD40 repeat protein
MKPTERDCPDCGLPLPAQDEEAGCPHCLFRLAMGDEPGHPAPGEQPAIPHGLRSRFFGDYEILSELARGGMGVIYRARQISLKRTVALKMIQPGHLPSPEAWLRFQNEIAASAHLNHPNIVPLHESGTFDGAHFFTMRLMEGGNLAARLAAERKAQTTARTSREAQAAVARLMVKVARAVHHAHQRGVLHRDLKPSNILLDERGEPQVADFGLAKMLARESAATLTDSTCGSPNYMAPEQADGRGKDVTVETDVYGLGAVLYECLAGEPPFQARTPVETIRKVLDEEPAAPRRLNPGIDADLETICLKCLQKLPGLRYRSAEEFATDLEFWLAGRPILARPVGWLGTAFRWARRHPALAGVSAALVLTLVAVAVGASVAAVRIRQAEQAALVRLRDSLVNQARVLRISQAPGARRDGRQLLQQAAALGGPREFQARVRDEFIATLSLPQVDFTPLPDVRAEGPQRALMDHAMNRLARFRDGTNLLITGINPNPTPVVTGVTGPGARLECFSPDGRSLAVRHARGLDFHDTETGRVIFSAGTRSRVYAFAAHAPLVALEEADCEITLRELPDGAEQRRFKLPPDPPGVRGQGFTVISVSPDGALIAVGRAADNAVELLDANTGRLRWRLPQESSVRAFAWQPSRSRLLAGMNDGRLVSWRLSDGAGMAGWFSPSAVRSLALDDATGLLAGACQDRRVRVWDLYALRQVYESDCEGRDLAFDENGTRLGTVQRGDQAGWLTFDNSIEFKETVVAPTTRNIQECAFTGRGDLIAIGYPGRISLMNATGRGARGGVNIGEIPVLGMDPRGEFLLTSDGGGVTLRPLPVESGLQPASRLVVPGLRWRAVAPAVDGSRFWMANAASNMIYGFPRDFSSAEAELGPLEFVDAVAASPDGRWVAGGSSLLMSMKVWDTKSREAVLTLHAGRNHRLSFSRDGRWLAVHGDVFELRRTGTWEPAPALPYQGARPMLGAAAFSPDGKFLAVIEDQNFVRLFDLEAWQAIGLLPPPTAGSMNALAFSPDGTRLAAACSRGRLRVWDLAALRRELALLKLNWPLFRGEPARP